MRLMRTALATAGLAVMIGGCVKPKPKVVIPKPKPVVVVKKPKPKVEVKNYAWGYEINYEFEGRKATYRHREGSDGVESCLDLTGEGKDWVQICKLNGKVLTFNNYTRDYKCTFKKKPKEKEGLCGSNVYDDSLKTLNSWLSALDVPGVHKAWLKDRYNPLKHWKK